MKVEVVGKHQAILDGKFVKLRPVTLNSLRGGKWYIRFFQGQMTVLKVKGQTCGASKNLQARWPDRYHGKQRINTEYFNFYRGRLTDDKYYLSDLGVEEVKHPEGATLFEFDHNTLSVLKAMKSGYTDTNMLMGYPRFSGLSMPMGKSTYR